MSDFADLGTGAHAVLESCLISIYDYGIMVRAADYVGHALKITDEPHSRLSPSGAKRWMACPYSVHAQEQYPEQNEPERTVVFDADYAAAVQEVLDYVKIRVEIIGRLTNATVKVYSEQRVSGKSVLGTDIFDGTVDIVIESGDFIEVVDFKAGAGVPVDPDDPQLGVYLHHVVAERTGKGVPEVKTARLTVAQPRCDKISPRIRSTDVPDVLLHCNVIGSMLRDAMAHDYDKPDSLPVAATDGGCRFCAVGGGAKYSGAPICREYERHAMIRAGVIPDGMELPDASEPIALAAETFASKDTRTLTPEQLVGILQAREILTGALQAAEAWALSLLEDGTAPPELTRFYKLVHGRANRRYLGGEEETFAGLKRIRIEDPDTHKRRALGKKDLYETVLKSPAKVERILKGANIPKDDARWQAFNRLIEHPKGKLTIAPLGDPRPAVDLARKDPEQAFANAETVPDAPPLP